MSRRLLLKGGTIVNAHEIMEKDLLIDNGKIIAIEDKLNSQSDSLTLDVTGCYLLPGGIDPHVHMELPVGNDLVSADNFETGSLAALFGGTTTLIDFVTPKPDESLLTALRTRKEAASVCYCDYSLHMSITSPGATLFKEMSQCIKKEGIPSFKIYMAYKDTIGLDDAGLLEVMDAAARLGGIVMIHCEHSELISYLQKELLESGEKSPQAHPKSRPAYVEREAVVRALALARGCRCPLYFVHISSAGAIEEIRGAAHRGQAVFAETCPQYLLLNEGKYNESGFSAAKYVISPPLRPRPHQGALWTSLTTGDIQVIATDHCPFNLQGQKEIGKEDFTKIPNGAAGVEHRIQLLYTYGVKQRKISLQQMVSLTSTMPAKIFGLFPQKGQIALHSDADIVAFDPHKESTINASSHHHNCDTNIFENMPIIGQPRYVILRGEIAIRNQEIKIPMGFGNFLPRINQSSQ